MKVLISAYACSPYEGSEPSVGWGFVTALAKHHDLWVIVEEDLFRTDIEQYLLENPKLARSVRFHFLPRLHRDLLRKLWPPSYYWYYRRWHKDAHALARNLHLKVNFDISHQLNMAGFREPGYLWKLDIPFVWGPVGGMGLFPWRFLPKMGLRGACYYAVYNIYNLLQMRFMQRPKQAAICAGKGLVAINTENQSSLRHYYGVPSKVCANVGPPSTLREIISIREISEPLQIVWSGLHIHRKALNLALEALSLLPRHINWELHILGDGTERKRWERLAINLGVDKYCKFYGQVSREQVLEIMGNCHVHLFTSLREGTPTVIVEAFSFALPTICLDCSGMSDMVNESSGIKIPISDPGLVIFRMADALRNLAENEKLRQSLARGALDRADSFSWEKKAAIMNRIYRAKTSDINRQNLG